MNFVFFQNDLNLNWKSLYEEALGENKLLRQALDAAKYSSPDKHNGHIRGSHPTGDKQSPPSRLRMVLDSGSSKYNVDGEGRAARRDIEPGELDARRDSRDITVD